MKEVKVTVLTSDEFEDYTCACGNTSMGSGFLACSATGADMEPTVESGWAGFYACQDCGNVIIVDDTKEEPISVVGDKKILKVKGEPGSKYCLAFWDKDTYTPWVTWGCNDAVDSFFYGKYFANREDAEKSFVMRGESDLYLVRKQLEELAPYVFVVGERVDGTDGISEDVNLVLRDSLFGELPEMKEKFGDAFQYFENSFDKCVKIFSKYDIKHSIRPLQSILTEDIIPVIEVSTSISGMSGEVIGETIEGVTGVEVLGVKMLGLRTKDIK